jgi:hypothetical protein
MNYFRLISFEFVPRRRLPAFVEELNKPIVLLLVCLIHPGVLEKQPEATLPLHLPRRKSAGESPPIKYDITGISNISYYLVCP